MVLPDKLTSIIFLMLTMNYGPINVVKVFAETADDVAKLIDSVCVPKRFEVTTKECDGQLLLDRFERQTFNYYQKEEVRRYGQWLRLLNNLQYYKPHDRSRTMNLIAAHNQNWVKINANIDDKMRSGAAEVFRWTSDTWSRFHETKNFSRFDDTLPDFVDFFNTFVLWCSADTYYFFKVIMHAYNYVRHMNPSQVDYAAKNTVKLLLTYPLTLMSPSAVKRAFFVLYVQHVPSNQRDWFKHYFIKINKSAVMPHEFNFGVGPFNFTIHHNLVDTYKAALMRREVYFVYDNTIKFLSATHLSLKYNITDVEIFVYENKKSYEFYGPLWLIKTDNGGYTQANKNLKKIESHVYYESDKLPRNYGHEVQHALMYAYDIIDNAPLWFVEGIANRLGNRRCYAYDHDTMKTHVNLTAAEIVTTAISYGGHANDLVYGMGSALADFFYKIRPNQLGEMIKRDNYTFIADDALEHDFDLYKKNKISECNLYVARKRINATGKGNVGDNDEYDTKTTYIKTINSIKFVCKNYVQMEFNDVIFVMTRAKLIKMNTDRGDTNLNIQRAIRFNDDAISLFDYEWFLKGTLKSALEYFGDITDALRIDSNYSYKSRVSCDSKNITNPRDMIARFSHQSGVWNKINFLENMNYAEGRSFVQHYISNRMACCEFINPVVMSARTPPALTANAASVQYLKSIQLLDAEKKVRLDARGNTILHLLALFNHKLYSSIIASDNGASAFIRNNDNKTPDDLYSISMQYKQHFGKQPNRYCFTSTFDVYNTTPAVVVVAATNTFEISTTQTPVILIAATTSTLSTTITDTTTTTTTVSTIVSHKNSNADAKMANSTIMPNVLNGDNNDSIELASTTAAPTQTLTTFVEHISDILVDWIIRVFNNESFKYWCIILLITSVVILINIKMTILIVKCTRKRKHKLKSPVVLYKINDIDKNDECTIDLIN
ncbi:hypothetical protein [Orgyia leucostigma nucleopolyhedrovirus]|uniref:Uncharacterized protein n=1 Tax=Orgyia leucostigma nucleopolyhedrovirus TaxID=490711 RepID=B0FDZ6_9ABAC|nr:hypothetical protein [Orgyia leucostigma nucleopolyhedrovirus]ABY65854.1 hypothetical protein [Orgyia leucostigma nucleopolyhedrovirus]